MKVDAQAPRAPEGADSMQVKLDRRSLLSGLGAMAVPGFLPAPAGRGDGHRLGPNQIERARKRGREDRAVAVRAPIDREPRGDVRNIAGRPNVIVVVADDMRATDWQALPEIRRIVGGGGAVFPNFILNTPICGPSRATLFTGKLPRNHGVMENDEEGVDSWSAMEEGYGRRATIYNAAQKAGYRTGLVGKFLNGAPDAGRISPAFDRWYSTSELDYYNFTLNENGVPVSYDGDAYSTDVLGRHAVSFIEETEAGRPFLLFFAPKAPKGPATPSAAFDGAFRQADPARDPAWNEDDISDKPASVRRRDPLSRDDIAEIQDKDRRRLETLLSVDAAFTDIWRAVRRTGRAANTIVVVLTDNGYALGEHLITGKGRPYDPVIRVPMMASGPGFDGRGVDDRMASMADIAPTLAQAMGIRLANADGASLLENWTRQYVPLQTPGGQQPYWALRSREELYVEYDDGEREYYDLVADPYELENQLADWEGRTPTLDPARAEALAARLAAFRRCDGESCRGIEPPV
ncbi:MAG: sulfatase [Chloroflexota bacterium]